MPNWVYNTLTVTGTKSEVDAVSEQVEAPFTRAYTDTRWNEGAQQWDTVHKVATIQEPVFSFWNIKRPDDAIMDEYVSLRREENTRTGWLPDAFTALGGILSEEPDAPISNHWYDWNIRNWGTKWDAGDASSERYADDHLNYSFSTAWSPPIEAITELSIQHPSVSFTLESEEEQGWGVELEFVNGEQTVLREWDIPNSHADYVERDNVDGCICSWDDDPQYWFDDCPKVEVAA